MNSDQPEPSPNPNIISPHQNPADNASHEPLETSSSQNDSIMLNQPLSRHRPFQCLFFIFKVFYYLCVSIKCCVSSLIRFFCNNKIIAFMSVQMTFVLLRMMRIINEKTLFWLTLVAIFTTLLIIILYLCTTTVRSAAQIQTHRQQVRNEQRAINVRRAQALNMINDRLMEQIFLTSTPNRLNLYISGPAGGMRLMHLEHNLQDMNGTRAQIRLISRGLMRLLAEFIEEQQLNQDRNQRNGLTEEQINALPIEKFVCPIIVGDEEAETCSICIDEFKGEQELRRLPCNHRFHKNCIDEWLKISSLCPNCKAEISPNRAPQNSAAQEP